jgi:hypothetical protein
MVEIAVIALYFACGAAVGGEARRKGYSYGLFLVLGLIFGPLTLIGMWLLPVRQLEVGTPVRTAAPIELEDGGLIPPRHVTVVRRVRDMDGVVVCQISAPDSSLHWVAADGLTRLGPAERPFGYVPS